MAEELEHAYIGDVRLKQLAKGNPLAMMSTITCGHIK